MPKESVNITLDDNVVKKIREEAAKQDRSFSSMVNVLLKNSLKRVLLLIMAMIFISCSVGRIPPLDPGSGTVKRCSGGIATIVFSSIDGNNHGEADFLVDDCPCDSIRFVLRPE